MALAQAANIAEKALGHDKNAITKQDMSTFPSGADVPKPKLVEDRDVILKVTGSTVIFSVMNSVVQPNWLGAKYTMSKLGNATWLRFKSPAVIATSAKGSYLHNVRKRMPVILRKACGFAGGQAEYVRVPMGDVNLLEIPEDIPDEKALFLSDVLATSYHCVVDTGICQGDKVAIFGAGPIGQMAGRFALIQGAEKIIFVDTEPRTTVIKSHFKSDEIDVVDYKQLSNSSLSSNTVVSQLKKLCDGRGPDVALECAAGEYPKSWLHWLEMNTGAETDTSEIVNECIESVRSFGRCGVTGVYAGFTNHFNIGSLMQRGIRLIGNGQAPVHKYWKGLLEDIQEGRINPLEMVSHRVRLEDLDKVYHVFDAKRDGMQKVFVETKFSFPAAKGGPTLTRY
ncbi:hypothetical protein PWT90_00036 [Aphanocladium album]|nr:hypothetical protein PWT90_00036 [Aphanocladium album]